MLGGMSSIRSPIKSTAKQCQLDFTENTARKRNPVTQFGRNAEFLAIEDGRCRMLYVFYLELRDFPVQRRRGNARRRECGFGGVRRGTLPAGVSLYVELFNSRI